MHTLFFAIIFSLLLGGCASKEEEKLMSDFNQKTPKFQLIQQTQKATIIQDDKVVGLISALYLHSKNNTTTSKQYEKFIVGIYSDDDIAPKILLNGKEAINIAKLANDDPRLEGLPLKTKWNRYYMASFLEDNSNQLILKISLGYLGDKELIFPKTANCVNTQKAF